MKNGHLVADYGVDDVQYANELIAGFNKHFGMDLKLQARRILEDVNGGSAYLRFGVLIEKLLGPKTFEYYESAARVMSAVDYKLGISKLKTVGGINVTKNLDKV